MPATMHLRAAGSAYAIAGGIFVAPLLIALAAVRHNPSMWAAVLICGAAIIAAWLWLSRFELELTADGIRSESPLRRSRTLRFSEIGNVTVEGVPRTLKDKVRPAARLVIHPGPSSREAPIVINMKVFNRRDFQTFVSAVEARAPARPNPPK